MTDLLRWNLLFFYLLCEIPITDLFLLNFKLEIPVFMVLILQQLETVFLYRLRTMYVWS